MGWYALVQLLLLLFCVAALSSPLDRRDTVFAIANLSVEAVPLSHRVQCVSSHAALPIIFSLSASAPAPSDMALTSPSQQPNNDRYFFLVRPDSAAGADAECSALVTGLNESVCSVPPTACSGSGLAFEWRQLDDGGAELRVVRNLSSPSPSPSTQASPPLLEAGGHRIGRGEMAVVAAGTEFEHQAYVGPPNFSMPVRVLERVD
ncbi:hypothetical protein RB595_008314 [Gaeumannomyces hyphopodioides]